jgi:RNA polymerase sigma-54 factor
MAAKLGDSEQAKQIKEQLNEARGLIKSVQSRGETLLRVGRYIVEKQYRFFEEGEQAMQPLVLREVAEALDLHESTISRATNQKYMQTPRGTFELKYFFSTGVSQYGSEDQSAIAIKAHIKELIAQEDSTKPLSDNKLMELLEEKDINVARRTIAKYREALGIPSSSERKKWQRLR